METDSTAVLDSVPEPLRQVFDECVFEMLSSAQSRESFLEGLTDAFADYRQRIELRDSEPAMDEQREAMRKFESALAEAVSITDQMHQFPRAAAAFGVAAFRQDLDDETVRATLHRLHGVAKDASRSLAPKKKPPKTDNDPNPQKTERRSARRELAIRAAVLWHWALKADGKRSDSEAAHANLIEIIREVLAFVGESRVSTQSIERELRDWQRTPAYIAMTASAERRAAAEVEARRFPQG